MSQEPSDRSFVPILANKYYHDPSVFTPENLLREARRQKGVPAQLVPEICVLDPDGDLVDYLLRIGQAKRHPAWACYHTTLWIWEQNGVIFGIIGRVVGASFAVLVAEELFVCGCQLLISITSAGQLMELGPPPYVVLIDRALRDEGTSYHYLPPTPYATLAESLCTGIVSRWDQTRLALHVGGSWTTDAPFRETERLLAHGRGLGLVAIEMEAAALYALATAKGYAIVCFAHVTNQMARIEGDFEKGVANGSMTMLEVLRQISHAKSSDRTSCVEEQGENEAEMPAGVVERIPSPGVAQMGI